MPYFSARRVHPVLVASVLIFSILFAAAPATAAPAAAVHRAHRTNTPSALALARHWLAVLCAAVTGDAATEPPADPDLGHADRLLTRTDLGGFVDPNGVGVGTGTGTATSDPNPQP